MEEFPNEVLYMILEHICFKKRQSTRLVSKTFDFICRSMYFTTQKVFKRKIHDTAIYAYYQLEYFEVYHFKNKAGTYFYKTKIEKETIKDEYYYHYKKTVNKRDRMYFKSKRILN